MPQLSITKICLKIICLKLHSNFPWTYELSDDCPTVKKKKSITHSSRLTDHRISRVNIPYIIFSFEQQLCSGVWQVIIWHGIACDLRCICKLPLLIYIYICIYVYVYIYIYLYIAMCIENWVLVGGITSVGGHYLNWYLSPKDSYSLLMCLYWLKHW